MSDLRQIVETYDSKAALSEASTIPAGWYTNEQIFALEKETVFSRTWQFAARLDQLETAGNYVTTDIADEPVVVVRGNDGNLRGFFNVCRHHAAAVMTEAAGHANHLRCPYHGWTYSLEGELKGAPDFADVRNFDRTQNGLLPIDTAKWEKWILACVGDRQAPPLEQFLGTELIDQFKELDLEKLQWLERRRYLLNCNWKVFVDNYLDGGYHVPHLHKGLNSILDYSQYTIENGERFCLQSSPMVAPGGDHHDVGEVRKGQRALYYWLYPNFMINVYEGTMDTNLVRPLSVDRTEVIFDFYFADNSDGARQRNLASIDVGERIQHEDVDICEAVQRGLRSRAYTAGRLSVRREAGEHLFHRLLYADLKTVIDT